MGANTVKSTQCTEWLSSRYSWEDPRPLTPA
jgi:hypothetical protein